MNPIVIIPCSKEKRPLASTPAEHLYVGPMFTMSLAAAERLTEGWRIRIMSAKHGLLSLNHRIDDYDVKLGDPGSITTEELRWGLCLLAQNLMPELSPVPSPPIISLLPRRYHEMFIEAFGRDCREIIHVFADCRGIGDQRHVLAEIIEHGDSAIEMITAGRNVASNIT